MNRLVMLILASALVASVAGPARAETLRLEDAVSRARSRYRSLAVKRHELAAAEARATGARDAYLPDVTAAAQQSFGTVNGAFGPQTPIGFQGISSAGPTSSAQSWSSAFGANYLFAVNWELFTFGRIDARIALADASTRRATADLEQEKFVHGVRVASAYLELLVATQVARVAAANLERAVAVESSVEARARTGLVPAVDLSTASAEVSRARLSVVDARDRAQRLATQLAVYLDAPSATFELDESFLSRAPSRFVTAVSIANSPQLRFQAARIDEAEALSRATSRSIRPGLALVGAYHMRASGFEFDYTPSSGRYSSGYLDGVLPDRSNFIVGLTLSWNLMSPLKNRGPNAAAEETAASIRSEQALVESQLQNETALADARIENMREFVREVPRQLSAAAAAYEQKKALYDNGLATLVEVQQALYVLSRAEVDRSAAYVGLWQALLQKAAAAGDFELFSSQARQP
ncbi:MAG: TolC family protein [Labilithrix sp.]|nr:TolC family protein [Labilithrix sp.]